jgi:hypothetical protein
MRPRLTDIELNVIVDSLEFRIKQGTELLIRERENLSWNQQFRLEQTLIFLTRLKQRLNNILQKACNEWYQETPITDLVLHKRFKKTV